MNSSHLIRSTFFFAVLLLTWSNGVLAQTNPFCTATTPYNANNPATFPLTNATSNEASATTTQLNCSLTAVSDYITKKHNCLRSTVSPAASNMLKIQWNTEAAAQAKQWADNCVYAHNAQSARTTSQFACGQNIAMSSPLTNALSWNAVINLWYNEVNSYVYGGANSGSAVTGHYTQIVWAKTWQVGCAWTSCSNFNFYVCNYCPAGNFQTNGVTDKPYVNGSSCASCSNNCEGGTLCTNNCPYTDAYSNCDELNTDYQICDPSSYNYNLHTSCPATCQCQGMIY